MPPFQVINRQEDPSARLAIETSNSIAQHIKQKQAYQLTLMEYKQKAKESENEVEKMQFEQKVKILDAAFKAKEQGLPAGAVIKMLTDHYGPETVMKTMGEGGTRAEEFAAMIDSAPGSGERELRQAQAGKATAEAGYMNESTNLARSAAAGGTPTGGQGGSVVATEFGPSGAKLVNLGGRQQEIMSEERAKVFAQSEPFIRQYKVAKSQFYEGLKELGGLPEAAGEAKIKGFLGSVEAEFGGNKTAVQTFNRVRDSVALTLSAVANRGRPSDKDTEAIKKIIPEYLVPEATSEALFKFIEAGFPQLAGLGELDEKARSATIKSFVSQAQTTIIEADRRRVANMKKQFPNATEDDINNALRAIHQKEEEGQ